MNKIYSNWKNTSFSGTCSRQEKLNVRLEEFIKNFIRVDSMCSISVNCVAIMSYGNAGRCNIMPKLNNAVWSFVSAIFFSIFHHSRDETHEFFPNIFQARIILHISFVLRYECVVYYYSHRIVGCVWVGRNRRKPINSRLIRVLLFHCVGIHRVVSRRTAAFLLLFSYQRLRIALTFRSGIWNL